MRYSVKHRLGVILENVNRLQELAGMPSDPEAGYVAPINAYEDNYSGLKKRFGNDIINRIVLFVRTKLNTPITLENATEEDLNVLILNTQDLNIEISNEGHFIIRFGGYMHDSKEYNFNLGYKDQMGQLIFKFKFTMDINGNFNGWESLSK